MYNRGKCTKYEKVHICTGFIFDTFPTTVAARSLLFKNIEYDQEIPQSQTADKPMEPRGRATQQ